MKKLILAFIATLCCNMVFGIEKVYLDDAGVIRWTSDGTEVSLFGANYCLPSACDRHYAVSYTHLTLPTMAVV